MHHLPKDDCVDDDGDSFDDHDDDDCVDHRDYDDDDRHYDDDRDYDDDGGDLAGYAADGVGDYVVAPPMHGVRRRLYCFYRHFRG